MKAGDLVGGKYRLVRRLGQGAMGVVWEAVHEMTSRSVAVKLIVNATDNLRARLLREAKAAGQIAHRNVVEVYDVGENSDGDPFLVMQLLSGETLYACIKRDGALEKQRALNLTRDICRALVAAHSKGIVHRDLKPANVFLHREAGSSGEIVKVLDFGLCKPMGADEMLTVPGGLLGSPAYMSPEQIAGVPDLDPRTDIWSLGVLMFEVIAGKRPFAGRGPDLIHAVITDPIPRLRAVMPTADHELDEIIARCLVRDRNARFSTTAEVLTRIEAFIEREAKAPASSSRAPLPSDNDEGELAATMVYRPGAAQAAALQHKVAKTIPLNAYSGDTGMAGVARPPSPMLESAAPPPASSPSSSSSSSRRDNPMSSPPSAGGWPQQTGGAHPSALGMAGPLGTSPLPRMNEGQMQQWAAQMPQIAQMPQQQPPSGAQGYPAAPGPQGYPAAPGPNPPWQGQTGQNPAAWQGMTGPNPAVIPQQAMPAPRSNLGLFVGIVVVLCLLLLGALYLGFSGPKDPHTPAASSTTMAPAAAPKASGAR